MKFLFLLGFLYYYQHFLLFFSKQTSLTQLTNIHTNTQILYFYQVLFLVCISGVALAQAGSSWLDICPTHLGVIALMVSSEVCVRVMDPGSDSMDFFCNFYFILFW